MKFKILLIATWLCCAVLNTYADAGYVNFTGPTSLYDDFTTPGIGVRGHANIDVAFLWNTNNAPDSLPSSGAVGHFSHRSSPSSQETATNGLYSAVSGLLGIQDLLANGWSWASNDTSFVTTTVINAGSFIYNTSDPFPLNNTTPGGTYEFIVVGWDAASGSTAILNGNVNDFGWSNPFSYLTGLNTSDPNGFVLFNGSGMNQFGVVPVPEPTTLSLTIIGMAIIAISYKARGGFKPSRTLNHSVAH